MPEGDGGASAPGRRRVATGAAAACALSLLAAGSGHGGLPADFHQDQTPPRRGLVGTSMTDVVWSGRYLWVATERSLARWNPTEGSGLEAGDWVTFGEEQGLGRGSVSALAARGDTLWAATLFDTVLAGVERPAQVGSGLSWSVDGGSTWTHIPSQAIFDPLHPGFAAGPSTPIHNACFGLAVNGDTVWAAFFAGSSVRSTDFGRTWERVLPGGGQRIHFVEGDAAAQRDGLRFLADSLQAAGAPADTVARLRAEADSVATLYLLHRTFSVSAYGDTVWIGTASGAVSSFDFGRTWRTHRVRLDPSGQPLPGNLSGNWALAIERQVTASGSSVVWVGAGVSTGAGQVSAINRTEDGGRTWSFSGPTFAWDLAFAGPDTVWAGTDEGLLISPDLGLTWLAVPVEDPRTRDALRPPFVGVERLRMPDGSTSLWAGADNGLGRSADGGRTWAILSFPLKVPSLDAGQIVGEGGPPDSTGVRTYAAPSPFAPSQGQGCRVVYSLSADARVTVEIYDFASHQVRTLVDGVQREGGRNHGETWDGRDDGGEPVANGVYFIRVETEKGQHAFCDVVVLD